MNSHCATITEDSAPTRLLADLSFVGAVAVAFLLVSCPMPRGRAASNTATPDPLEGAAGFALGQEGDDGPQDAEGSDAGEADLIEMERPGRLVGLEGNPLDPFFAALGELEESGSGLVRVLHYGDSHTAADILTTEIRRALQQRFGDGGRGFVLLGNPWQSYRPRDVAVAAGGDWETRRVLIGAPPSAIDGLYGLGGLTVQSSGRHAWSRVRTSGAPGFGRRASSYEIFYLRQPRGGSFEVRVDGRRRAVVTTAAAEPASGFARFDFAEGAHELELRVRGDGEVRLFGAVVEADGPGVVYDTLGVNGGFFHTPLRWNGELLAEQIRRRNPELIVVMYGTNDADSRTIAPESYGRQVARVLERFRDAAPQAACLLLGPPDRRGGRMLDGEISQLDWIVAVQEETAAAVGCAFLDLRGMMGGAGSFDLWQQRGLAQPDGVHLTAKGYQRLGQAIAAELFAAHANYLEEIDSPAPRGAEPEEEP
jgi:lysophospholipase L1-like esterase